MAAGNQVGGVVRSALGVGLEVVERQYDPILQRGAAPATRETVSQVDGQSLYWAYPVHSLGRVPGRFHRRHRHSLSVKLNTLSLPAEFVEGKNYFDSNQNSQ
jgi:hypothetical protein